MAMVMGAAFVVLGLVFLVPNTWNDGGMVRWFSVLWVAMSAWITLYYAYNLFSARGVTASEYEISDDAGVPGGTTDVDALDSRLRKLAKLRDDGLIGEDDFERQRSQVLSGQGH
jgi:hypothetical protein